MKLSRGTIHTLVALLNMLAGVGGLLVVLGAVQETWNSIPPQIEDFMNLVSSVLTLVGVLLVTSSVYFFEPAPLPRKRLANRISLRSYWH
jgi:hypothetical protein